ncbi:MAG: alpha/beta hydrolase [Flavobacteriaceae bacterium]|nr:MAG: alpha/beta hydrolase [Flavobacteriaceae bacterium]
MTQQLIKEDKFSYLEKGEGQPIIVLHGLMGALSNFEGVLNHFSKIGYKVLIPELPIFELPLLKTNVKNLAKFVKEFIEFKQLEGAVLLGNSLGGHVALYFANNHPEMIKAMVLAGSSGLYENSMGDSYPKRGDYEYIKEKTSNVFYDPKVATKELVDEVYEMVNDRRKTIKILAIAKSAIRHNMSKDLPNIKTRTCLIWGKNDTVTPPEVAFDFEKLLPNASLYWIDKCGHTPMMEHVEEFNGLLENWFKEYNI